MAAGRSVCKSAGRHGSEGTLRRKGMEGGDGTRRQPRTGAQTGRGREHGEEGIYNRIEGIGTAEGTGREQGGDRTEKDSEQVTRGRQSDLGCIHALTRARARGIDLLTLLPAGRHLSSRSGKLAGPGFSFTFPPPSLSPFLLLSLSPPPPSPSPPPPSALTPSLSQPRYSLSLSLCRRRRWCGAAPAHLVPARHSRLASAITPVT